MLTDKVRLQKLCEKNSEGDYIKAEWLGISNIAAIETILKELEEAKETIIVGCNLEEQLYKRIEQYKEEAEKVRDILEEEYKEYGNLFGQYPLPVDREICKLRGQVDILTKLLEI